MKKRIWLVALNIFFSSGMLIVLLLALSPTAQAGGMGSVVYKRGIKGQFRQSSPASRLATYTVCPSGPPDCDYAVIQAAVDAASPGDLIKVATGTYTDINDYTGLAQILYLDKAVTIRGGYGLDFTDPPDPEAHPTILDAQNNGRGAYITDASPTLEGLTFTGGDATGLGGTSYGDDAGGGLYIWGGAPVISASVITGNMSPLDGGGVFMRMYSAAQIVRSEISNNTAYYGGGIYVWYSYPTFEGNLIASNVVTGTGGGVWLGVYSSATFAQNEFTDNSAALDLNEGAGGMLAERCTLTMDGNIFQDNTAVAGGGGLNLIRCQATLSNNIFAENYVEGTGGGLFLLGSEATLVHNTFTRNQGGTPSGLYLGTHWEPRNSIATLSNTLIVSETVGVYAEANNSADLNATLWGAGGWANGLDVSGPGTFLTGTVNLWGAPAFIAPASGDYHLGAGSAAIDAGIDAGVYTDLDGEGRPFGAGFDIGADEYTARNLVVTTLADELNTDGDCSLREALTAANDNTAIDACLAGDGTLTDTITFDVAGLITVAEQLSVTAGGPLVVDGGEVITVSGNYSVRVLAMSPGTILTLRNLALVDGRIFGPGGGILNQAGTLVIENSLIDDNRAIGDGGGIANQSGTLVMRHSRIANNIAEFEVVECYGLGGGVFNSADGTVRIIQSTIANNQACGSGGIHTAGQMTIADSLFMGNQLLSGSCGGGLWNSGVLTVSRSTFLDNVGRLGGGICNDGLLELTNSTFSGNQGYGSYSRGGGIANGYYWSGAAASITNSTFFSNTAALGGAIYSKDTSETWLYNTIVAGGPAGGSCAGTIHDGGHNLDSADTCGFDPANGSLINTDPLLGPLQDNGGGTWTHALPFGSPAIDAADPGPCPLTDQRGVSRPQDGDGDGDALCDIGAFEYTAPVPPAGVTLSGPTKGYVQIGYPFTATVSPLSATTPISFVWQVSGGAPVTHTGGISAALTATWELSGTQVLTVTASNPLGTVTTTHTITITMPRTLHLPLTVKGYRPVWPVQANGRSLGALNSSPLSLSPFVFGLAACGAGVRWVKRRKAKAGRQYR